MGRTKGSKNGISTTPGYTAIGDLAKQIPAGYKRVVRRVAGRAGGPVHLKYELVPDENYSYSNASTTNTEEEPEKTQAQQEEAASKTAATKGPDNDIARRVEKVKERQKAAGSEYAKQLYKLKLKREQAKQDARERAEATDVRNILRQNLPQAAMRINSPSDVAKYRENEKLLKEVSGMLEKAYAKRTKGAPTINSAYDLAAYKKKKK
jgi:flagellar biosynthesis/type III secretory pathway protein FliH